MALIQCPECGKEYSDKAAACPNCGCPIEEAKNTQITVSNQIRSVESEGIQRTSSLRDYLEKIKVLETDIYTIDTAISGLIAQIKEPEPKRIIKRPEEPVDYSSDYETIYKPGVLGTIGDIFDPYGNIVENIDFVIWNKKENKRKKRHNEETKQEFQARLKQYREVILPKHEADVKAEDERYEKYLIQTNCFNEGLNLQISKLREERKKTDEVLQTLYNVGVIYPKYREMVPITMFCEYMDSGRRTVLEGIHGMYDLYEAELLGKKIVDQLSTINGTLELINYRIGGISSQLTGIQRNQILLYEEVARGNNIADRICASTAALLDSASSMVTSMTDMRHEIGALRSSAEMTAFNTEATARRVDALAKIEEYEFSLRHPLFPSV